jgi:hypothetical protein
MRLKKTSLLLGVIMFALTGAYAQNGSSHAGSGSGLIGTWLVTATPDSGTPSSALITFTKDHVVIATSTTQVGVTQGHWQRGSQGSFTLVGFQWEYDTLNVADGLVETSASFALDSTGQQLSGRFEAEFHDTTANQLLSQQSGSWSGVRLHDSEEVEATPEPITP